MQKITTIPKTGLQVPLRGHARSNPLDGAQSWKMASCSQQFSLPGQPVQNELKKPQKLLTSLSNTARIAVNLPKS
jgi:hypothetical protein